VGRGSGNWNGKEMEGEGAHGEPNGDDGFIAIVARGECTFAEKVRFAQAAGAVGVIVCDNVQGGARVTMESSGDTSDIVVPSVFLSLSDCTEVARAMEGAEKRGEEAVAGLCGGLGFELRPMSTYEAVMAALLSTLFICAVTKRLTNQRRSQQGRAAPYAAARRTTQRRRLAISEFLNLPTRVYTKEVKTPRGEGVQEGGEGMMPPKECAEEASDVEGTEEEESDIEGQQLLEQQRGDDHGEGEGEGEGEGSGEPSCSACVAVSESDPDGVPCVICLDNFEESDVLRVLPCRHEFHQPCVDRWFTEGRQFCPMCKWDFGEALDRPQEDPAAAV